jgi:hypothetical protein
LGIGDNQRLQLRLGERASTAPSILLANDTNVEPIGTAASQEGIKRVIEGFGPARYHVDEICSAPLLSGHTSRRWGVGIKRPDGVVTIEFCKDLSSAKDEWEKCADDLEQSGVAALADRMREAWDAWSESREVSGLGVR